MLWKTSAKSREKMDNSLIMYSFQILNSNCCRCLRIYNMPTLALEIVCYSIPRNIAAETTLL